MNMVPTNCPVRENAKAKVLVICAGYCSTPNPTRVTGRACVAGQTPGTTAVMLPILQGLKTNDFKFIPNKMPEESAPDAIAAAAKDQEPTNRCANFKATCAGQC